MIYDQVIQSLFATNAAAAAGVGTASDMQFPIELSNVKIYILIYYTHMVSVSSQIEVQ